MRLLKNIPRYLRSLGLIVPIVASASALTLAAATPARAADIPRVRIGDPDFKPLPIAITTPQGSSAAEKALGRKIAGVVTNNMRGTGLFRILSPASFIQKAESATVRPRFADWSAIGAFTLVTARVSQKSNGDVRLEFRLWDVANGQQMLGKALEGRPAIWRRLAHKMSDAIYNRLTGESGYFDTRVVFISETGPVTKRVKRLTIMDQDGNNLRYLTSGRELVLTPRFSPSAQEITYLAYVNNRPRVFLLNIDSGRREVVGDFPGMTFSPRFSPDGNKVIMSMEVDGNSEIYAMDLRSRSVRRLTNHQAIDTSPSYSPDGTKIVFNSDRSGRQKIYVMNADGSGITRISNKPGRYATPVWSPRGDRIAFTKIEGGVFSIGVMRPNGEDERILAQGFVAEGPTWAPNGRVLMYFKQARGGAARLFSIDITGRNERLISTPTAASDPAWSPILKD